MIYLRGHPRDYDQWANVTGDPRWSYRNLVPYFKKSENYCFACEEPPRDVLAERKPHSSIFQCILHFLSGIVDLNFMLLLTAFFHRAGGPLSIGRPSYNPLVDEFLRASAWNGIPRVDLNGPYKEGESNVNAVGGTASKSKHHRHVPRIK